MSEEATNTVMLKACYDQWDSSKGGSIDAWMGILAEDIDFRSLAMGCDPCIGFTRPRSSRAEVRGYLEELVRDWEMIHFTVDNYIAQGDCVAAIGSTAWRNRGTGREVGTQKADIWRFRDGKAVAFFEFYDTAAMLDAAT